ncbi:MAG: C1 family peptidase [Lishizhenia sp.]
MPIRLVPDKNKRRSQPRRQPTRRTSSQQAGGFSGGGLGNIIGLLLPLVSKNPKLLLVVVVVGGLFYLFGMKDCGGGLAPSSDGYEESVLFNRGTNFNEEIYAETEIYEPLADNRKNPLPERVDLRKYCPTAKNQGQQGSCVAWAAAYAGRTIIEAQRTGQNPDQIAFSPSFMYNQIKIKNSNCQGSYIKRAMDNMLNQGAVDFQDFRYTDQDCSALPSRSLLQKAAKYKTRGFQRLTEEGRSKTYEMLAMKQNLAKGSPIIIGMMVGGSFMQDMMNKPAWIPSQNDYAQRGFGGHAMCVVGYDDYLNGGSFLLMNSWGTDWGKDGFAWVRYSDFRAFNKEAYGIYPMGNKENVQQTYFSGSFGLEDVEDERNISLRYVEGYYFETVNALRKSTSGKFDGTKFKIEFTNNIECYTYVIGYDGAKSINLFPYTPKHSPYCGITGTRLFPREESLQPDEMGTKDIFAIIITKKPIDFIKLNQKINNSKAYSFEDKIAYGLEEMGERVIDTPNFNVKNGLVAFETRANNDDAILMLIGVNKK